LAHDKRDNGNGNGRGSSLGANHGIESSGAGQRAFEVLGEFLRSDGWHPRRLGDKLAYGVQCSGRNANFACYVEVRPDLEQVLVYAVSSVRTPEEARHGVAEFITRANYGLRIGNFELDFSDGEVRFKTSLDFQGEQLTFGLLKGLLYPAVQTLDIYLPGVLAVAHGDKTPLEAILLIEGGEED
jgi:hypothetical protein